VLTSVSSILTRALRRHSAALLCSVSSHELLEAYIRAAELSREGFIIVVKGSHKGDHDTLHALLATTVWRLEHHQLTWGIALDLSLWNAHEQRSFLLGLKDFPALTLISNHQQRQIPKDWSWIEHTSTIPTVASLQEVARSLAPQAISIPIPVTDGRSKSNSVAQLAALRKASSQPLIAQEALLSPLMLKRQVRAGISGITLDEQLEEAFTAGLRTGLRNRSLSHPEVYLAKGRLAVTNCVVNYLSHLN